MGELGPKRGNLLKIRSTPHREVVIPVAGGAAIPDALFNRKGVGGNHEPKCRGQLLVLRNYDSLKVAKCLAI